jgi:hypothetical protein
MHQIYSTVLLTYLFLSLKLSLHEKGIIFTMYTASFILNNDTPFKSTVLRNQNALKEVVFLSLYSFTLNNDIPFKSTVLRNQNACERGRISIFV